VSHFPVQKLNLSISHLLDLIKYGTGWTFNFNFWTGATRQDFSTNGSIWCPARVPVSSPWGLVGSDNKTLMGKADCIALQITRNKTNYNTVTYNGNLIYRNCSQRQIFSCRVFEFFILSRFSIYLSIFNLQHKKIYLVEYKLSFVGSTNTNALQEGILSS
jgi:hypothetical protein